MYLTYEDYTDMGGTVDAATFPLYEAEAEALINWYTFNRIERWETIPEAVKNCMYKLITLAQIKADAIASVSGSASGSAIASQSNDGVSISYNMISASEAFNSLSANTRGNVIESIIRIYLSGLKDEKGRNILYRGVYEDE